MQRELSAVPVNGDRIMELSVLGTVQSPGDFWGAAVSEDGRKAYFSSTEGAIYHLGPGGKLRWKYEAASPVWRVRTTLDGRLTVAGSKDGTFYCFESSGSLRWSRKYAGSVIGVAISPDGMYSLAGDTTGKLSLINTSDGELIWETVMDGPVRSAALDRDGEHIIATTYTKNIYLLSRAGDVVWKKRTGRHALRASVSPEGGYCVAISEAGDVKLIGWDGHVKWSKKISDQLNCVSASPCGSIIAVGGNSGVYLYRGSGDLIGKVPDMASPVVGVDLSASGIRLCVGLMPGGAVFGELPRMLLMFIEEHSQNLESARRDGVNVALAEAYLNASRSLTEKLPFLGAQFLRESMVELERAFERFALLNEVTESPAEAADRVTSMAEKLGSVEALIREGRYEEAKLHLERMSSEMKAFSSRLDDIHTARKSAVEAHQALKAAVEQIQEIGLSPGGLEEKLASAEEAISRNDYTAAVETLRGVESEAVELLSSSVPALIAIRIAEAEISEYTDYVDVSQSENALAEARKLLSQGAIQEAVRKAEMSITGLKDLAQYGRPVVVLATSGETPVASNKTRLTVELRNTGKVHARDVHISVDTSYSCTLYPESLPVLRSGEAVELNFDVEVPEDRIPQEVRLEVKVTYLSAYTDEAGEASKRIICTVGPVIEDIFLVHRDGRLMVHNTRRLRPGMDSDVLSGMFTAIVSFVEDSLRESSSEGVNQIQYGNKRILIEYGPYAYIALVISGIESPRLRGELRALAQKINTTYVQKIEQWDGDRDSLEDISRELKDFIFSY